MAGHGQWPWMERETPDGIGVMGHGVDGWDGGMGEGWRIDGKCENVTR